jgi:hypothetical protein
MTTPSVIFLAEIRRILTAARLAVGQPVLAVDGGNPVILDTIADLAVGMVATAPL